MRDDFVNMQHDSRRVAHRKAFAVVYLAVAMFALMGVASLAVDFGRVQMVRSEMQAAADAAAGHAAGGMSTSISSARNRAQQSVADNKVEGVSIQFDKNADVEFGTWEPTTRTFTPLTGAMESSATAVRITIRRTADRGTAVPLTFAKVLGHDTHDVTVHAIATRGKVISPTINAKACPWLAGMPNGSVVAAYGGNPRNTVMPDSAAHRITDLSIVPGQKISFRQTTGMTSYDNAGWYNADGNTGWIVRQNPTNGINATRAPLNSLVGIFLDDRQPNTWTMAPEMDFTSASSRNYKTLSPQLKQVFFIGDGVNDNGELQEIVVPAGATRFYLAIMDEKGWWWDNVGTLNTTMLDNKISSVR